VNKIFSLLTATAIAMATIGNSANAHLIEVRKTPYVKISDNFYMGFYCVVADGSTKTALKPLITALKIGGMFAAGLKDIVDELAKQGADRLTLSKGDTYCFWMHVNQLSDDQIEDGFERRDFFVEEKYRVRTTTTYHFTLYNDAKVVSSLEDRCTAHTRCFSKLVEGTDRATKSSAGFAACFEPDLPGGKKASIVLVQGKVPAKLTRTTGKAANKSCDARKAEFTGE
jgi:hypothetical protein